MITLTGDFFPWNKFRMRATGSINEGLVNSLFYERTIALVGTEGMSSLSRACVAVFGIGGVGSYAFEALVRAGVGKLVIIDADEVEESNCNRQLIALKSTIGTAKVDVAAQRALDINPHCKVETHRTFITSENLHLIKSKFTHAIDAIDSIESKISLIRFLKDHNIFFVSCMGGAQRLDPTKVRVADISRTFGCPHAKSVRRRLRTVGIEKGVRCVFSIEQPKGQDRKHRGSISYVPGIIGLTAAGIVILDILQHHDIIREMHEKCAQ
ncbi:MAG: tRNA threonylcarbamoyladenosine dehydratase [Spirochaetes bacterium]|nr:tRNA threonylcarbamoyladenosine dehydratase [Spirochaetota bacterium]